MLQLRVGLYTFKVTVTAENKYGEAYVNITVLPRKCCLVISFVVTFLAIYDDQ